jgi:lipoprotein-anchoring transpeptidase ErfK/SrfK
VFGSSFGRFVYALFVPLLLITSAGAASASVVAVVDVSTQRMYVTVDGGSYAVWKVSTARRGYYTPRGSFRPKVLKRMHYSRKYENSPMPYSVFFSGGYAIHGTQYVRRLGSPASHGCIRLHTANAANLYYLIKRYGQGSTRIRVVN